MANRLGYGTGSLRRSNRLRGVGPQESRANCGRRRLWATNLDRKGSRQHRPCISKGSQQTRRADQRAKFRSLLCFVKQRSKPRQFEGVVDQLFDRNVDQIVRAGHEDSRNQPKPRTFHCGTDCVGPFDYGIREGFGKEQAKFLKGGALTPLTQTVISSLNG